MAHDGKCCVVAEADHHEVTMTEVTKVLAANAAAVLAVGTCAAYGGIPAGKGNETGAMGVSAFLKRKASPPRHQYPRLPSASRLIGHHRPRPSGSPPTRSACWSSRGSTPTAARRRSTRTCT
ncbi:MAG: hypothetical protein ACLSAH_15690 [Bilophila wadsworthia]